MSAAMILSFFVGCKEEKNQAQLDFDLLAATAWPSVGDLKRVQEAVKSGANVNCTGDNSFKNFTPLLNAAHGMNKEWHMSGKYQDVNERLQSEREAVKIVKFLAAKGANIQATDESPTKRNALHLAALGGRARMIRALVELGLAVDSRDAVNGTALMHAASGGCYDAVAALVELGADVNAEMNGGRTALDAAHQANTKEAYGMDMVTCKEHDQIIALLEQRGAKRRLTN
jgi:ankyrin repeat protein